MLQLSAVQKPGSSHGCGQFDEEGSIFPFGNFTAFEATLDLWPGDLMEKIGNTSEDCNKDNKQMSLAGCASPSTYVHPINILTQVDNFGKLNMAASSIFIDAADSETVVAFTLHAVTGDLGRCGGL